MMKGPVAMFFLFMTLVLFSLGSNDIASIGVVSVIGGPVL